MSQLPSYRIAAVQMISEASLVDNLASARHLIRNAAELGAHLVALPENFAVMSGNERDKIDACEQDGQGPIQDFLAATAQQHNIFLIGGTVPLASEHKGKVRNSCLAYSPAGTRIARYDKIHLFGFDDGREHYNESETVEPGNDVVTFNADCGRVGLSVCYDLRFPELFRAMGEVDLIVLPAAFTYTTGIAHWEVLLRARAIENQCYVLAPAQGGHHSWGRRTYGDSMIVDPWGEILVRCDEGSGVVVAEMSAEKLNQVRTRLPALKNRYFI